MKILILMMFMLIGVSLLKCDTDNNDISIDTPPSDWITGVWRSEDNDSVKFINEYEVYINSILYAYYFEDDSIELYLKWCPRENKSLYYEFDINNNHFIIYNYDIYDSIYYLHNPDSTLFIKSIEELQLPFEEWIQGLWTNPTDNRHFLFSKPYKIQNEDVFFWCKNLVKNADYIIYGNCIINTYVFAQDTLKVNWALLSNYDTYSLYLFEMDKENNLFILYSLPTPDTATYYKKINL